MSGWTFTSKGARLLQAACAGLPPILAQDAPEDTMHGSTHLLAAATLVVADGKVVKNTAA